MQLAHAVMTLEGFHDSLRKRDGTETIALRTLEAHACAGRLPGAFKLGGIWMLNMIALIQEGYGIEDDGRDTEEEPCQDEPSEEEEDPAPPEKGNGKRRANRRQVASPMTAGKRERLRYSP